MDRKLSDLFYSRELTFGWPGHLHGYSLPSIGLPPPLLTQHSQSLENVNSVGLQSKNKESIIISDRKQGGLGMYEGSIFYKREGKK